ncbi:MAG TPA: methyl-accepting chemotaxis protein [Xanthomonadaceae bacterium]|nr:methyl-accepting chemotaxis protein [Xanthomonadaceae bacterium]
MSNVGGGLVGRARNWGINIWISIMAVSLLVFGLNFGFQQLYNSQESNGRGIAADISVKSQQLAVQAKDAVAGDQDAFAKFKDTRTAIETNIKNLQDGSLTAGVPSYRSSWGITGPLQTLADTWSPIGSNADLIVRNQDQVLAIAQSADQFTNKVQPLKSSMDEVAREMSDGGAPAAQLLLAMRQINLADTLARDVAVLRGGGPGAQAAADALARESSLFSQVLKGFQDGDPGLGITKLNGARAVAALSQVSKLNIDAQQSLGTILKSAKQFAAVQDAEKQISDASSLLLANSQALNTAFGTLSTHRPFPNSYIAILSGALSLFGIAGLLVTLDRQQKARFRKSQEDSQRNQEAIMRLLNETGSLAEGDLTVRATVTEDITGAIADSINLAVEELRSLVTTINETAVQVAAASQETQATAMHLAEAAEHQAQQINTASDKINEMAVSIDEVSKNSAESADVAQRSVQIAAKGADVVRQTIQGMDSIRDQIQETSKRIKRLGESSQEIGSIVELINDISEQTNILALNAAIQAASAGEAGRGFAVVADEVQRLAERASNATKRIETLVQTIQSDTNEAVNSMEQTTAEVVSGARLAEDAGLALGEIETVSTDLANLISNISTAAKQQSTAATDITATMNSIQEITSQTSHGASQTAESIGNLAQLAANLRRSVADFKLPG